eukprot:TRINITY_DN5790_c0_g1_i1.p2 TRINITY_DN5790_c0_g1~~TRINITY_DN5790_c0_g1_i1.p2  ORF type:complete len:107 (-),score=7.62 TRINITY_DN5790_c0_g1_i1:209-529(-)
MVFFKVGGALLQKEVPESKMRAEAFQLFLNFSNFFYFFFLVIELFFNFFNFSLLDFFQLFLPNLCFQIGLFNYIVLDVFYYMWIYSVNFFCSFCPFIPCVFPCTLR